jgi:hypothetical protein
MIAQFSSKHLNLSPEFHGTLISGLTKFLDTGNLYNIDLGLAAPYGIYNYYKIVKYLNSSFITHVTFCIQIPNYT